MNTTQKHKEQLSFIENNVTEINDRDDMFLAQVKRNLDNNTIICPVHANRLETIWKRVRGAA